MGKEKNVKENKRGGIVMCDRTPKKSLKDLCTEFMEKSVLSTKKELGYYLKCRGFIQVNNRDSEKIIRKDGRVRKNVNQFG